MNSFEKQSRSALTETNLMIQFVDGYIGSLSEAEEFVNSERGLHIFKVLEVVSLKTTWNNYYRSFIFQSQIKIGQNISYNGLIYLYKKNTEFEDIYNIYKKIPIPFFKMVYLL